MDRVTVRSFRDVDLAERGIKDLARSRLDTTRAVVFQPLGNRFLDAREDPARIASAPPRGRVPRGGGPLLRAWSCGSRRSLPRSSPGSSHVSSSGRIEEATRDALRRELPRAQGVYLARFEPDGSRAASSLSRTSS